MNNRIFTTILAMLLIPTAVMAMPTLQVGAPGGPGEGTYADYIANTTNPTETDTAITGGSTILFAGVYGPNTLKLGGQYIGAPANGLDYSKVDAALTVFDTHNAIAVVAVEDGKLATAEANLMVGGVSAFHTSATLSGLFPNNHDPLKDLISDFLFFDIGNFAEIVAVPDFADETVGMMDGEIKSLAIAGTAGLDWIHFDVVALATNPQGQTSVRTSFVNNPGSHDVTWKDPNAPPPNPPNPPANVPEPSLLGLLGLGLLGAGMVRRQRRFS